MNLRKMAVRNSGKLGFFQKGILFSFVFGVMALMNLTAAYAQNSEADFKVEVTRDGRGVVILEYVGKGTVVHIPATIQDIPVREIASNAFPTYSSGFYGSRGLAITRVMIPEGVTTIRERAFYGMEALTAITLPESLTYIGNEVFRSSGLTSVAIPNNVTAIRDSTFYGCSDLKSVDIPNSVTIIWSLAFYNCSALESINIPSSIALIAAGAFRGSGLVSINWPARVSKIFSYTTYDYFVGMFEGCENLQTVIIPEGVTEIGGKTFQGCTALTSVTLPSTIQSIGRQAFQNCTSLTTIIIPDSVEKIGFDNGIYNDSNIFRGCQKFSLATQAALRRLGYTGSL